jgi:hypothetical protein
MYNYILIMHFAPRDLAIHAIHSQTTNGIAFCPDHLQTAADKMARLQTAVIALAVFGLLACASAGELARLVCDYLGAQVTCCARLHERGAPWGALIIKIRILRITSV